MLYFNYLVIYSVFGFLLESLVYKIGNMNTHSGILYGPYTFVYGFGVLASILIYENLDKYLKKKNKYLKVIIYFLFFTFILTLIEYLGGNILNYIFDIDMWDYSYKKFHFGKYICLSNAIIWGLLGTLNIYFIYPKLKKFLMKIPNIYSYIILGVILIDTLITLIIKVK